MLACAAAGADVVDVAIDSTSILPFFTTIQRNYIDDQLEIGMSGMTSQPSMGAVCSALEQTHLGTGISHENIQALNLYWSSVRTLYTCFDANVKRFVDDLFSWLYSSLTEYPHY
jgi:pyruvate carboxylase